MVIMGVVKHFFIYAHAMQLNAHKDYFEGSNGQLMLSANMCSRKENLYV